MKQDLARRSFQAAIWSYIGGGGKIVAQLVIQIGLARMLGPEVFGQYAAVLIVIGIGWLFADSGFGAALIQKEEVSEEDVGYALGWILILSVVSGISISALSPHIAQLMGDAALTQPLMVCGPIIVLQALSNLSASLMRRDLDMKRCQLIQLGAYIVGFGVVAVLLAYSGAGVWSLVFGFLAQTLIVLVSSYAVVRHTLLPRLTGDASLRRFGFSALGTNLANWAIDNLDRFLIGRQWGIPALGAYSAASNLSRAPIGLLVSSIQSVVFSSASRIQDDPGRLARAYISVVSLTGLITLPLSLALALKAEFVIHLLYGDQWHDAIPLFSAFCVAIPLYVLLAISGPMLWAIGAVASEFKIQLFAASALLAGLVMLANRPLLEAIWLIPCIYLLRLVLVYSTLAKSINLSHLKAVRSLIGGALLACTVLATELATDMLMATSPGDPAWINAIQLMAEALACYLLTRLFPYFTIGAELSRILLSRSTDSRIARVVCALVALKRVPQ